MENLEKKRLTITFTDQRAGITGLHVAEFDKIVFAEARKIIDTFKEDEVKNIIWGEANR